MRFVADTAVKTKAVRTKPAGPTLGEHLKHQNVFFYISAICSVVLIALLFLPWVKATEAGVTPKTDNASILTLILKCQKNVDLLIFLIPVTLGFIGTQVAYLISLFRPGHDAFYPGTAIVLLAGIEIFLFVFATDSAYKLITDGDATLDFFHFIGSSQWTWIPTIWFVLTLLQKLLFVKLAHKKKKA